MTAICYAESGRFAVNCESHRHLHRCLNAFCYLHDGYIQAEGVSCYRPSPLSLKLTKITVLITNEGYYLYISRFFVISIINYLFSAKVVGTYLKQKT